MNRLMFWTLLLFFMWMILTANFELTNIFLGLSLSFMTALMQTKLFKEDSFETINLYYLVLYIFVLGKNLLISNFQITKRTLSRDMNLKPAIVAVKTELTSEWKKLLLANSITLTPGTLTLDIEDDMLYIHIIECNDMNDKQKITEEFERVIAKI